MERLGYLPLAIDQAGAYLSKLSKPLGTFLPLFEANFKTTLNRKPPSTLWQYGEKTVVTTWEISFEAIQREDPQAAELLLLCSFLFNEDINSDFLFRGLPEIFRDGEYEFITFLDAHYELTVRKDPKSMITYQCYFRFPSRLGSKIATVFQSIPLFIHGPEKGSLLRKARKWLLQLSV